MRATRIHKARCAGTGNETFSQLGAVVLLLGGRKGHAGQPDLIPETELVIDDVAARDGCLLRVAVAVYDAKNNVVTQAASRSDLVLAEIAIAVADICRRVVLALISTEVGELRIADVGDKACVLIRVPVAGHTAEQHRPEKTARRGRGLAEVAILNRTIGGGPIVARVAAEEADLRIDDVAGDRSNLSRVAVTDHAAEQSGPEQSARCHRGLAEIAVKSRNIRDGGIATYVAAEEADLRIENVAGKEGDQGCVAVAERTAEHQCPHPAGRGQLALVAVAEHHVAARRVVAGVPALQAHLWVDDVVGKDVDQCRVAIADWGAKHELHRQDLFRPVMALAIAGHDVLGSRVAADVVALDRQLWIEDIAFEDVDLSRIARAVHAGAIENYG